ncbi:MAG: hypothetical protein M3457_03365, partial [Chloroflexota bacterium]|nr:hypothetical protein [Chloroflexota bacterium]
MPNRPVIGQTTWGTTLNDHLDTSINVDGTLKDAAITSAATTINGRIGVIESTSALTETTRWSTNHD